jgi:hypothetical protein
VSTMRDMRDSRDGQDLDFRCADTRRASTLGTHHSTSGNAQARAGTRLENGEQVGESEQIFNGLAVIGK